MRKREMGGGDVVMKIFKANGTYVWLKIKMFSTISKVLFQRDCA